MIILRQRLFGNKDNKEATRRWKDKQRINAIIERNRKFGIETSEERAKELLEREKALRGGKPPSIAVTTTEAVSADNAMRGWNKKVPKTKRQIDIDILAGANRDIDVNGEYHRQLSSQKLRDIADKQYKMNHMSDKKLNKIINMGSQQNANHWDEFAKENFNNQYNDMMAEFANNAEHSYQSHGITPKPEEAPLNYRTVDRSRTVTRTAKPTIDVAPSSPTAELLEKRRRIQERTAEIRKQREMAKQQGQPTTTSAPEPTVVNEPTATHKPEPEVIPVNEKQPKPAEEVIDGRRKRAKEYRDRRRSRRGSTRPTSEVSYLPATVTTSASPISQPPTSQTPEVKPGKFAEHMKKHWGKYAIGAGVLGAGGLALYQHHKNKNRNDNFKR